MFRASAPRRLVLALCVLACGLAACGADSGQDVAERRNVAGVSLPEVTAHASGRSEALVAGPGEVLVVYFGYTSCPDVCPTTMADLRSALRGLPAEDARVVVPAMVTIDPAVDDARVLNGWLGHFFSRYRAYRPDDDDAIADAAEAFGASVTVDGEPGTALRHVRHTGGLYAVDADGWIRAVWPFGTPVDELRAGLRSLIDPSSERA